MKAISSNTGFTPARRQRSDSAFTLVELAVALIVIGVLIGGILKGMELVENARVIATIHQVEQYQTAVFTFKKRYRAAPGDMQNPSVIPGCTAAPCAMAGDGNKKITGEFEKTNFWLHLAKAGMISGIATEATTRRDIQPETHFGGQMMMSYVDLPRDGNWRAFTSNALHFIGDTDQDGILPTRLTGQVDKKWDDGLPSSGAMRSVNGDDICVDEAGNQYYLQLNPQGVDAEDTQCVFFVKFRL